MSNSIISKAPTAVAPTMLHMKDLTKVYPTPKGDYVVLDKLQLEIRKEEFVSIIGHSGCGKTTLLTMIAGLNEISGGQILLNDSPIDGPSPERAVIFQSPSLLPWMTALENVMLGANKEALVTAVSEDYGHRSRYDTLIADILPTVAQFNYTLSRLAKWMKPNDVVLDCY